MCPHDKSEAENYMGSRTDKPLNAAPPWYLFFATVLLGAALPIISAVFIDRYAAGSWVHQPLHTLILGGGAFVAILLALFIMLMQHDEENNAQYIWLAAALMGIGVLDSFHAAGISESGSLFLHSLTSLVGGLLLALVILPSRFFSLFGLQAIPCLATAACFVLGTGSLLFSDQLPIMRTNGQLTLVAKICNMTGGAGFFLACLHFSFHKHNSPFRERLVLACTSLLFATAAFCFPFSTSWRASWWFWHFLHFFTKNILQIIHGHFFIPTK